MRVRHIILLSVTRLAVPYFSAYLINGTIFMKLLLRIKCVFFVMSEKNSHFKKIQSDVIKSAPRSSRIVTFIPLRFYSNLSFLDRVSKILKYQIS